MTKKLRRLHIDIETYNEDIDLKKQGVYRYGLSPSTDLNIVCYALDNGPVHVWFPWKKIPQEVFDAFEDHPSVGSVLMGEHIPRALEKAIRHSRVRLAAHNAQFERVVLNNTAGKKHGFPEIPIEKTICTMAKAVVHGLPEALEHCANALGTHPKSKAGSTEMRYIAKPRKDGTRPTIYDETKRFISAAKYCVDDVLAERDIDVTVPDLTEREEQIYFLDQRINGRGIKVDLDSVVDAQAIVDQYKTKLSRLCIRLTRHKPTQNAKLADWVRSNGYPQLPNLQAPTVLEALEDEDCPRNVQRVLKLYSIFNMKAVSKLAAMLKAACEDGRLRGMLHYYGAGPGRWSSRIVQLQNLMRPVIKNANEVIDAMWLQDMDSVQELNPKIDLMKAVASCIRGMLVADTGKKLMAFDFAQIESRIQAWLSGAKWKLDFFESDSEHKIYHVTGSMMFGCDPEDIVDKGEKQLYTSAKIGELACGYQGGEAAIDKFARDMHVRLTIPALEIRDRWRSANREQVRMWDRLEQAAFYAVDNPGKAFAAPGKKIIFKVIGRWLYMRLPSGRRIAYLDPKIRHEQVTYMGINTYTRKWERVDTYGGKLMQNACEGIGRDLLVNGLLNMEAAGYTTVLSVHDEGVFEVDDDFGSEEEAMRLMTVPLDWAKGLPVKCDGYTAQRYRK